MSNAELTQPGVSHGLTDIVRSRYLLRLLVRKEVKVRYRGSVLGIIWSYVRPATQFLVFYIALGVFLGLEKSDKNPDGLPNYAIYLFSGIVLINFFNEALGNAARSIVGNGGLIKKIYLPRQLFPVASIWVSAVHFFPQVVILLIACFSVGWRPTLVQLLGAVAGFIIIAIFALGLGLLFGSINVFFRDSENFVDMLLMVSTWTSPVLYSWTMVRDQVDSFWLSVYQSNPITVAVELFHAAFWVPTVKYESQMAFKEKGMELSPENLGSFWLPVGLGVSLVFLLIGYFTFRKLEGRFAQEL